jgi:hypothetical protein
VRQGSRLEDRFIGRANLFLPLASSAAPKFQSSEEKREPVSDIDTGVADSLKVLDPDGRLEKRTLGACAVRLPTIGRALYEYTSCPSPPLGAGSSMGSCAVGALAARSASLSSSHSSRCDTQDR